jgi:putative membrane protein
MERLFWHIIGGTLAIFLVIRFVPGVALEVIPGKSIYFGIEFDQQWKLIILVGGILGLINFFVKPILDALTIPLKILTFGLFSLIVNMGFIWFLEIIFEEFEISGIIPLFFTTMIVWLVNFFLGLKK